jgi:hypothetical protein
MTICPLYEETESSQVETFTAQAEVERPVARLVDAVWNGALWRLGCIVGCAVVAVWLALLLPFMAVTGAAHLVTLGRVPSLSRKVHGAFNQLRFVSACGLGAFVAIFSNGFGLTLLCLAIISHNERSGLGGLVELIRSYLDQSLID